MFEVHGITAGGAVGGSGNGATGYQLTSRVESTVVNVVPAPVAVMLNEAAATRLIWTDAIATEVAEFVVPRVTDTPPSVAAAKNAGTPSALIWPIALAGSGTTTWLPAVG